jgi:hypothetical protein
MIRSLGYNKHLEYAEYSNYKIYWDDTWLYCATCTYNNKYDWRMFTRDEFCNDPNAYGWYGIDGVPAFILPVRDRGPAVT